MAALFDAAPSKTFSNAGVTSLTSASYTIGGNNRSLYHTVASGAGLAIAPNAVKNGGSGGTALSQIGAHAVGLFGYHSVHHLLAPSTGSTTAYASWAAAQDETLLLAANFQDVDQGTPHGTVADATGSDNTPTANAVAAVGDLVVDFPFFLDSNGNALTISPNGGQASIAEIEGADLNYEGMGISTLTAAGTSQTMSWTISGSASWGTFAFALNAAGGGGPTGNPWYYYAQQ